MVEHKANPSCANCHGGFDPMGLALENFDSGSGGVQTAARRSTHPVHLSTERDSGVLLNFAQAC